MNRLLVLLATLVSLSTACASPSLDAVLIRRDAHDLQKLSFAENARQIYYDVNLTYPKTALTGEHFKKLRALGWSKCTAPREGWESYIDVSQGENRERSVFQNISYWYKDKTLLTISMMYYASVTKEKRCIEVPDNSQQRVIILEHSGPDVKEGLGITCQ